MKKRCEENENIQFFSVHFKVPHCCLTLYHTIPTFNDPEKEGLENIVGKRENAGYQHFLLFPECFFFSMSDSRPGGCEFDPRSRRLFFPAYFRLSPLQKRVRKVVGGFGKKSCVSTGVRKPGNKCVSPTAMI